MCIRPSDCQAPSRHSLGLWPGPRVSAWAAFKPGPEPGPTRTHCTVTVTGVVTSPVTDHASDDHYSQSRVTVIMTHDGEMITESDSDEVRSPAARPPCRAEPRAGWAVRGRGSASGGWPPRPASPADRTVSQAEARAGVPGGGPGGGPAPHWQVGRRSGSGRSAGATAGAATPGTARAYLPSHGWSSGPAAFSDTVTCSELTRTILTPWQLLHHHQVVFGPKLVQ